MAGGRCQTKFWEVMCIKKACYRSNYSTFRFVLPRRTITTAILKDSGCFSNEVYCKVVFQSTKCEKCVVFLTDPYYLTISMVK